MIEPFPNVRPFLPAQLRWRVIETRQETDALLGQPSDRFNADGGGYVVASLRRMKVHDPAHHRAIRAMALSLRGGQLVSVPIFDPARIASPVGIVPYADGVTHSDGTGFQSWSVQAVLEEPVALRDDEALVRVTSGHDLDVGVWFSLWRGVERGDEAHMASKVWNLGGGLWRMRIGPQFRQGHAAGTPLNFDRPCCTMKLKDPDGEMWPEIDRTLGGHASAYFEEAAIRTS